MTFKFYPASANAIAAMWKIFPSSSELGSISLGSFTCIHGQSILGLKVELQELLVFFSNFVQYSTECATLGNPIPHADVRLPPYLSLL